MKKLIVGISGASGVIYGIRLLEVLKTVDDVETHLVMSPTAKLNVEIETCHTPAYVEGLADEVHGYRNQAASISSGSYKTDGMVVAPCSMKTLSAIVNSYADNLLSRAADVVLKERRRLVLMPREIPRLLFLIGTIHWFLFASAHSMIVDIDFVLGMHSPLPSCSRSPPV